MTVKEAIENRHTTKIYKDGPAITDEQINELIDAGHLAPSSNNLQQVRVIALRSQEAKDKYAPYYENFNQDRLKTAQVGFIFVGVPYRMMHADNGKLIYEVNEPLMKTMPKEQQDKAVQGILNYYDNQSIYANDMDIYDAAIMFSFIALRATEMGFGTTPMLGIKGIELGQALRKDGLLKDNERVLLAMSVGYEDKENVHNKGPRIRMDKDKQFKVI